MKKQLTLLLIILNSVCYGQTTRGDSIVWSKYYVLPNGRTDDTAGYLTGRMSPPYTTEEDSLTAERFFADSLNNQYMISYRYADERNGKVLHEGDAEAHTHYVALVDIIQYRGNKKGTILSNYKAIYSPTECSSDNRELWLKRLYQFLNNKK